MSNQEIKNQSNTKEDEGVNKRRRFIQGAGIAAPVVLTLASSPVFGAQCLSGLQSGNLSHPKDDSCWGGQSPGFWKVYYNKDGTLNPGVSCPFGASKKDCWSTAGFVYGDYGNGKKDDLVNGIGHNGTKLSATILTSISSDSRTLSQILLNENGSDIWHLVAAMLNSYYCQNNGSGQHYIITPAQFIGLLDGSIPVPGGGSAAGFIKSFAVASYHDLANSNSTCS